ncbi:MAG: hypothetical protein AAF620_06595 [Bacteroidota bacterium]
MKKILVLSLIVLPFVINAQCKYKRDETDRFSKKRTLETKGEILWMSMGANIATQGVLNGDSKFLRIQIAGGTIFSVLKGMELRLLTEGGEVVKLMSAENLISKNTTLPVQLFGVL